jgi:hypothetical protein
VPTISQLVRKGRGTGTLLMDSFTMLDKKLKAKKRPGLNERTSEGETLILDRINGQIHHLNSTASYVWKQCDGSSANAIAGRLAQAFQIDLSTVERDVSVLLREMSAMNLLGIDLIEGGCSQ